MLKFRALGKTNIDVSEIGFGGWGIGKSMWGDTDDEQSRRTLRKALEVGINFFDTAFVYGDGHSERLIGQVLKEARPGSMVGDSPTGKNSAGAGVGSSGHELIVATKIPPKDYDWPAKPTTPLKRAYPKDWIISCTERSLKNLQREQIDIQQFHVWTDAWLNQDEWKDTVELLKKQGKIRAFGVSVNDHQPESALGLVASGLVDSVQVIYNLFDQFPADELFPLCEKHNAGVIVRVPFDEGSLAGAFTSETRFDPSDFRRDYFGGGRLKETLRRIEEIKKDLPEADRDPLAAAALRFCLSHPAVSTVIPGMRRPGRVVQNVSASGTGLYDLGLLKQLRPHAWKRNFYEFVF